VRVVRGKTVTYESDATLHRLIDADTMELLIDPGFDFRFVVTVRIKNYDAPELFKPKNENEKQHAVQATIHAKNLLEGNKFKIVSYQRTFGKCKYKRYLGHIILSDGQDYGELMTRAGLAKQDNY
jgi:endonuclease YncB( thermonuclease family)